MILIAPWPGRTDTLFYVAALDGRGGRDRPGVDQHLGWIRDELAAFRRSGGLTDSTTRSLRFPQALRDNLSRLR
jgi:hypothetical protein